jgi:hypothetical protein
MRHRKLHPQMMVRRFPAALVRRSNAQLLHRAGWANSLPMSIMRVNPDGDLRLRTSDRGPGHGPGCALPRVGQEIPSFPPFLADKL